MNNRSNHAPKIAIPNQVSMETHYVAGPLSQPACTVMQAPGQMKMIVLGGMTKVEAMAAQIAGGLLQPVVLTDTDVQHDDDYERFVATRAVSLAQAIIDAAQLLVVERQQEQQEAAKKPKVELE